MLFSPGKTVRIETLAIFLLPTIGQKRILLSFGSLKMFPWLMRETPSEYRTLISAGTDPQDHEKKKREAEARRQGNTFENVAAAWYQVKISQNLAPNTIKDIWRSLDKYVFPFIGNTPVDTLTARRFVEALTPIKERGNLETLKRVLQRVNEVMDYAARLAH
ncbi:tyrosine-type recombinase/integrase [Escherichia coli]